MEQVIKLYIEDSINGIRLDKYLAADEILLENVETISRAYIQKLIKEGRIKVNGKDIKASYSLCGGEEVEIVIPKPVELEIVAEKMDLDIVYEDDYILVVNKPKNMVVHPAPGHSSGTLVNGLMYHLKGNLSGINGVIRPGIVHRIDMNTTGLLVVCKNDLAHISLAKQFKEHTITREYHAIVHNRFSKEEGTIDKPLGRNKNDRKKYAPVTDGKRAVTHYKVINNLKGNYSYISCRLETGRTHQIRVHMSSISHPLYGDEVYGPAKKSSGTQGQALHAKKLGFIHPYTGEYVEFDSNLPEYFEKLLKSL